MAKRKESNLSGWFDAIKVSVAQSSDLRVKWQEEIGKPVAIIEEDDFAIGFWPVKGKGVQAIAIDKRGPNPNKITFFSKEYLEALLKAVQQI